MNTAAIRAFLAKRIVGVPAGVFVLIFAGVVLFFAIRMRNSSGDTPADSTDSTDIPTGDGGPEDSTQQPDFQAIPQVTSVTSNDGNSTPSTAPSTPTNTDWQRDAINWLISNGYTVDVATSAITRYMNGESLDTQQKEARDKAISHFGIPPQSIPATTVTTNKGTTSNAPASKQGEPPLRHTVKGSRDNTPAELARVYYGTTSKDATDKIKSANTTLTVPYHVGDKVWIPARFEPHYFKATAHIDTQYEIAKRNGTTSSKVEALNPSIHHWPVKAGTKVRVR